MYLCNMCSGEFPFLIFEYGSVVCEKCSIRKNISNCSELDGKADEEEETVSNETDEDKELFDDQDTKQLLDTLDKIENPRIRAYFKVLAQQYFGEGLV